MYETATTVVVDRGQRTTEEERSGERHQSASVDRQERVEVDHTKVIAATVAPSTPQVADTMTRTVVTATTDTPLPDLIDEMVRYGISAIPIVDTDSRLVGIVTEADLMTSRRMAGRTADRSPSSVICCGDMNGVGVESHGPDRPVRS